MTFNAEALGRRGGERRRRWPPLSRRFWVGGRRRRSRRADDHRHAHVDIGAASGVAIVAVLLGSALDALFTLVLLQRGASEANPLMAAALGLGEPYFLAIKLGGTVLACALLAVYHQWKLAGCVPVARILPALAGIYAVVIAWELFLLMVR